MSERRLNDRYCRDCGDPHETSLDGAHCQKLIHDEHHPGPLDKCPIAGCGFAASALAAFDSVAARDQGKP